VRFIDHLEYLPHIEGLLPESGRARRDGIDNAWMAYDLQVVNQRHA
jgi:superfamily II DNA helicase RecQ